MHMAQRREPSAPCLMHPQGGSMLPGLSGMSGRVGSQLPTNPMDVQEGGLAAGPTQQQVAFLHQQFHGILVQQQALLLQYQQLEAYKQALWMHQSDAAGSAPVVVPWPILAAQEKLAKEQAVLKKRKLAASDESGQTDTYSQPSSADLGHTGEEGCTLALPHHAKQGLARSRAEEVLRRVRRQISHSLSSSARHDVCHALHRAAGAELLSPTSRDKQ
ncbi:hypothetical protein V8C86DRAFT_2920142 [Haematococcus lacustris]